MDTIINITPHIGAREIVENPRRHFVKLALDLKGYKLPMLAAGRGDLVTRIEAAVGEALKLSRAQFDPDRLRAFAKELGLLGEEFAAVAASLEERGDR